MVDLAALTELALRHGKRGMHETRIPGLALVYADAPSEPIHAVQRPSLCLLAQGSKEVTVAGKTYRYAAGGFLVSTVDLPITGEIIEASAKKPYLCWVVAIEPTVVYDVLRAGDFSAPGASGPGIFVGRSDAQLGDAVLRLVRCLDDERDRAVLAPSLFREIVYRLLRGRFGGVVHELGVAGSRTQRLLHAIERLKNDYREPMNVDELAKLAGMSVSTFHEHFKKVTMLSPLQYQKLLRLQEGRRLLATSDASAAEVAYRVGYQSPSQFSREYARHFGAPPMRDVRAPKTESSKPRSRSVERFTRAAS